MSGIQFDGGNSVNNQPQVQGTQISNDTVKKLQNLINGKKLVPIGIAKGGTATKKITNQNIENALMEPSGNKAVKGLLSKSPIGLTQLPSKENLENMGFKFKQAYHQGSPYNYQSSDGGHITVYEGIDNDSNKLENGERKIVYKNGRYTQEMYYDKDGNLKSGKIIIKDEVAGFTEKQYDFNVKDNKLTTVIS